MHTLVNEKLSQLKGKTVYFEPLGGNNGDNLIEMGSLEVFKRLNLTLTKDSAAADVIVINGSGDLSYHSSNDPIESTRQVSTMLKNNDKPVILLPSSTKPGNAKNMAKAVAGRNAPTIVFARDEISYGLFKEYLPGNIEVLLDYDMAFGLVGSEYINNLKKVSGKNSLLIVERFDKEGATELPLVYKAGFLRSLMPTGIKVILKKMLLNSVHTGTPFVKQCKEKVSQVFPAVKYYGIVAADISLPQNYTFDEFSKTVAQSAVVVSTRLHVCILAFMLDKNFIAVQFEDGNKLSGVFNYSLKSSDKANLWIKKK